MPKGLRRPRHRALARNTTQLLAARLHAAATLSRLARAMREGDLDGPQWLEDDLAEASAALRERDDYREMDI